MRSAYADVVDDDIAAAQRRLGQRVRTLREAAGLTMEALARRSAVSIPMISNVERGDRLPSLRTLAMIAEPLGTTPVGLLAGIPPFDDPP